MFRKLLHTSNDPVLLVMRLTLALVMFPHGAQKLLGWFGGYGFSGTMNAFTQTMHIPALFALLAILAESLGALGLAVGFLTRIAAFGITVTMAVAALMGHLQNGFFMNWYGTQKGEGFEYHLLAIALGVAIIVRGAGAYSLDYWLSKAGSTRTTKANLELQNA